LFISPFPLAFFVSLVIPPMAVYSLFYSLLVTEIVPFDQVDVPIPSYGDKVTVYGVWVQDTEFSDVGFGGWHEIHPVRFIEINGKEYGEKPYSGKLFDGVWGPKRLIVLDKDQPYRTVAGTVGEVVVAPDGDYHVHVNVDQEYVSLLKPSIFATSFPLYQVLKFLSLMPAVVIIVYVIASVKNPDKTKLGRSIKRLKG